MPNVHLPGPARESPERPEDELFTARLKLSPVSSGEVACLARLWTDERVRAHLGGPLTREAALKKATSYIDKPNCFSIHDKEEGVLVGLTSLEPYRTGDLEVSYQLFPEFWGRGYGKEVVGATISWGFDRLKPERIIAVTQSSNTMSRRLLESLGMSVIEKFEEFGERQTMYSIDLH